MDEAHLETLVAKLEGDGHSYQHMLDEAQHSVDQAADHVEKASAKIEGFGKTMRGFTEKAIAAVEIFGAGHWFKEAFEQFEDAEAVGIRLKAVLEVNGRNVEELTRRYKAYADELQDITTLEDDHILKLFQIAEGLQVTGDKAIRAVRDAAALAAYTGQSEEAMLRLTTAMAKGDMKGVQRFSRLVKELKGVKDAAELASRYHKLVEAGIKVGGELAETAGGRIKQLRVAWGNLLEVLGEAVSSVIKPVVEGLKLFTKWFGELDKTTQIILLALPPLIALLAMLPFVFGAIYALAAPVIALLTSPWLLAVAAGVAVAVTQLGGFAATWEVVKKAALSAWDWIKQKTAEFIAWVYPIWQAVDSLFTKGWGYVKQYASEAWEFVKGVWAQFVDFMSDLWTAIAGDSDVTWKDIADGIQEAILMAEFEMDHFSEIMNMAWTAAQLGFYALVFDIEHFFTVAIPTYLDWFGEHWAEVLEGIAVANTEMLENFILNLGMILAAIPGLLSGALSVEDVMRMWKPLKLSLIETLKTVPQVPERAMTDIEKNLADDLNKQAGNLGDAWQKFLTSKRREFGEKWEVDVGEDAKKVGESIEEGLGSGADKAAHKVDAAAFRSVEALSRILDFQDKMANKNNDFGGASGKDKPIKVEAVGARSQEANARKDANTDILKQINAGIAKIAERPPVMFEDADL